MTLKNSQNNLKTKKQLLLSVHLICLHAQWLKNVTDALDGLLDHLDTTVLLQQVY